MRVKRPRRHVNAACREGRIKLRHAHDSSSMDFVSGSLFDGRRLRALTIVDNFTRESPAIAAHQGIKGEQRVEVLEQIVADRSTPKSIRVDNGPAFISKALDPWAYEHGVTLDFSPPGKPTGNAYVESFNGRLRQESLNANWFLRLEDAPAKIEAWRRGYNESRPHTARGHVSPGEFAAWDGASPVPGRSKEAGIFTP